MDTTSQELYASLIPDWAARSMDRKLMSSYMVSTKSEWGIS